MYLNIYCFPYAVLMLFCQPNSCVTSENFKNKAFKCISGTRLLGSARRSVYYFSDVCISTTYTSKFDYKSDDEQILLLLNYITNMYFWIAKLIFYLVVLPVRVLSHYFCCYSSLLVCFHLYHITVLLLCTTYIKEMSTNFRLY